MSLLPVLVVLPAGFRQHPKSSSQPAWPRPDQTRGARSIGAGSRSRVRDGNGNGGVLADLVLPALQDPVVLRVIKHRFEMSEPET